eukprot:6034458-Pyramimonas_sp.AAC.1
MPAIRNAPPIFPGQVKFAHDTLGRRKEAAFATADISVNSHRRPSPLNFVAILHDVALRGPT